MKRAIIIGLALAMIATAVPLMADSDSSETIDVTVNVNAYAEISNVGSVEITIDGPGEASGEANFDVLANFEYDVYVVASGTAGDAQWQAEAFNPTGQGATTVKMIASPPFTGVYAITSGAGEAGKTSTWTLKVETASDDSQSQLEYLLAGEYEAQVTVSVVAADS